MKKVLLIFLLLLLTGCKAKYDLKFNFDGTINESGVIYIDNNLLGKNGLSSNYEEYLEDISYTYNLTKYHSKKAFQESDYFGYDFSHKYSSLQKYKKDNPMINILFNGLTINEIDHYVIFKTGENKINNFHNIKNDVPTFVENINISITLPYKVVKHNANRVDNITNTYTWVFSGSNNSYIDLEFRDNELYDFDVINLLRFVGWYIYFIIFILIVGVIIFLSVRNKSKQINRI